MERKLELRINNFSFRTYKVCGYLRGKHFVAIFHGNPMKMAQVIDTGIIYGTDIYKESFTDWTIVFIKDRWDFDRNLNIEVLNDLPESFRESLRIMDQPDIINENRNFAVQSGNINEVMKEMLTKFNLGDLESKFFAQNPDFPSYDIVKLLIEDKYKIPYEEITPEIRRMYKDEFFMILYSNKPEDASYLEKLMKDGPKSKSKENENDK